MSDVEDVSKSNKVWLVPGADTGNLRRAVQRKATKWAVHSDTALHAVETRTNVFGRGFDVDAFDPVKAPKLKVARFFAQPIMMRRELSG